MILKNENGKERTFNIILETIKDNNNYVVYKEVYSDYLYAGRIEKNKLKPLKDEEYDYLNSLLERIEG